MKGLLWAVVMIRPDDVGPGPSNSWSQDGYAFENAWTAGRQPRIYPPLGWTAGPRR